MDTSQWPQRNCSAEETVQTVKGNRRQRYKYLNRVGVLLMIVTILVVILLIITVIVLLSNNLFINMNVQLVSKNHSDEVQQGKDILKNSSVVDPDGNLKVSNKLNLISRREWLAQPPVQPVEQLQLPIPYVIIFHTATENCSSKPQCTFDARLIQIFHMKSRHWSDIGYNFLVGGDGAAYEGRGWKIQSAHTYGYNGESIGIAFIGSFNRFKPPQKQITACKQLIAKGVELGYIKKDYKLLAARQLVATQNPGSALYEDIKTWDHWSEKA